MPTKKKKREMERTTFKVATQEGETRWNQGSRLTMGGLKGGQKKKKKKKTKTRIAGPHREGGPPAGTDRSLF